MIDRWIATALAGALILAGCDGDRTEPATVTGTVTVAGAPLSGALITLQPIDGTGGPVASAPIWEGAFEFTPESELTGGSYRVRFMLLTPSIRQSLPAAQQAQLPPADAEIAPEFDTRSQLRCQLTPGANPPLDFEVAWK